MSESSSLDFPATRLRRILLSALPIFLAVYAAWLIWGSKTLFERSLVSNLAMVFTSLCVTTLAMRVTHFIHEPILRRAWIWISMGTGMWALGDVLRMILEITSSSSTLGTSPIDAIYLAGSLPFWFGILRFPRQPRQQFGRLPLFFDTTLVTTALVTIVWLVILQPIFEIFPPDQIRTALLYPITDLISLLLLINIFLIADIEYFPAPFGWVALGLTAYTFSDLTYSSLLLGSGYQSGTLLDLGWVLGDICLALGALSQIIAFQQKSVRHRTLLNRFFISLQLLLPLVLTLILGWYTLLVWQIAGKILLLGMWVTVMLALGLIARQGILTGEMEMQKYANLVNSVAEPAFVCNASGNLRLVNPALLDATGYSDATSLLNLPLQQILHPAQNINQILNQGISGGWSGEMYLRRLDSKLIPISLSLRPLLPAGDSRLVLAGTAHDLTEQKKQQAALQAAYEQIAADHTQLENMNLLLEQKVTEKTADLTRALQQLEEQNRELFELDRLKSDFVTMVSHELRAPLTNINGGIELLLSRPASLPVRAHQNLTLVQSEIQRLTRYVETILDLSALDAKRLPLYPAPIMLHTIQNILQQQMSNLPEASRVDWQIESDLPPLMADEQALSSILFHLLDNAFKYAPQGKIVVLGDRDGNQMRVSVLDSGPGIPSEALPRLFDRFYRINAADSQTVYGHGLGLYIVHRLIHAMDGEISAENRAEGGACFRFWLPIASQPKISKNEEL